jgi:hypothetical protein
LRRLTAGCGMRAAKKWELYFARKRAETKKRERSAIRPNRRAVELSVRKDARLSIGYRALAL